MRAAVERHKPQERREMGNKKVVNSPASRMCARVDCVHGRQSSSRSGFIDKPNSSQSTPARVRVREGLPPIADPAAYFKAWHEAKWGGDFDPVRVAVGQDRHSEKDVFPREEKS